MFHFIQNNMWIENKWEHISIKDEFQYLNKKINNDKKEYIKKLSQEFYSFEPKRDSNESNESVEYTNEIEAYKKMSNLVLDCYKALWKTDKSWIDLYKTKKYWVAINKIKYEETWKEWIIFEFNTSNLEHIAKDLWREWNVKNLINQISWKNADNFVLFLWYGDSWSRWNVIEYNGVLSPFVNLESIFKEPKKGIIKSHKLLFTWVLAQELDHVYWESWFSETKSELPTHEIMWINYLKLRIPWYIGYLVWKKLKNEKSTEWYKEMYNYYNQSFMEILTEKQINLLWNFIDTLATWINQINNYAIEYNKYPDKTKIPQEKREDFNNTLENKIKPFYEKHLAQEVLPTLDHSKIYPQIMEIVFNNNTDQFQDIIDTYEKKVLENN